MHDSTRTSHPEAEITMLRFDEVGVLPEPGDNVAISSRRLAAGTVIDFGGTPVTLPHTVLEGHRFVASPIATGEPLLSWNTPFARARRDLEIGDYVCTPTSLAAVSARGVEGLPAEPSAENEPLDPYELDESALNFGRQVTSVEQPGTFLGYPREQGPAGTRNHVVLMATSSRSSGFVTEARAAVRPCGGVRRRRTGRAHRRRRGGYAEQSAFPAGHVGGVRVESERRRGADRRHRR